MWLWTPSRWIKSSAILLRLTPDDFTRQREEERRLGKSWWLVDELLTQSARCLRENSNQHQKNWLVFFLPRPGQSRKISKKILLRFNLTSVQRFPCRLLWYFVISSVHKNLEEHLHHQSLSLNWMQRLMPFHPADWCWRNWKWKYVATNILLFWLFIKNMLKRLSLPT